MPIWAEISEKSDSALARTWRDGRAVECGGLEMPLEHYQRGSEAVYAPVK
jgi:hypothetical protein